MPPSTLADPAASTAPPTIDPVAAARWARLAVTPSPWLHEEVARRMAERLSWITTKPQAWLHWAALRGGLAGHGLVAAQYPKSKAYMADASVPLTKLAIENVQPRWWQRLSQPALQAGLPPGGGVQMVGSASRW